MKTNKMNRYLLVAIMFAGCMVSCTDGFEELNQDPKNPTIASVPALFNRVISTLGPDAISNVHHSRYYFQTQQLGNAQATFRLEGAESIWTDYYYTLKDVRLLYEQLETGISGLKTDNAKACLDILFAYHTLETVDYFGDIPFFEAGKGLYGSDYYSVAYDKHQDIYKYCVDLLKEASLALTANTSDQYSYGNFDTFLKGNITQWKKFANALLLRYGLQLADADASYAGYVADVLNNSAQYPLLAGTESIGLWPKELANATFGHHSASWREQNPMCLGTTMWRLMSENNETDGSGIFDPRCYVFFEPNNDGEWKAQSQNIVQGEPQQGVRGPYATQAYPEGRGKGLTEQEYYNRTEACIYSPVRFYLVCDEEFVPDIFFTGAEVDLMRAEAYNRGIGVAKNASSAKAAYEEGIRNSIRFWYEEIAAKHPNWIFEKPSLTAEQVDNYLAREAYSGNESEALKQIYKQLWIHLFRQPSPSFNLYRRTLNTPVDTSGSYNPADYNFYTVPYPESERNYNTDNYNAATGNGANNAYDRKKLFWHK